MTVKDAILNAEEILPGRAAPEGQLDWRWQAIIAVGAFADAEPEAVWAFALKWGASDDEDLRAAVATCLIEHLLEHHFDLILPKAEAAIRESTHFAACVARIWAFGDAETPANRARFEALKAAANARAS